VDAAEEHFDEVMCVNVEGPRNLALVAKEKGARLLQISTDYVFSGNATEPYEETDITSALSVYGRSKLQSENAVLKNNSSSWVVRTEWLYGARGKCFPKTIARLLSTHTSVDVVADQIGQPTWAKDLARVIRDIIAANLQGGIYNVSSSGECSWYEFARVIAASASVDINRVHPTTADRFPRPAHRPHYSVLADTKLRTAGIVPIPDWEKRWNVAAPSILSQ
jgi:dTDP-4-dehydrorhamnose reductase